MPKYDYRCQACGNVYEKRESFSAPAVQECPTCRGEARRVLTPPAIVFKGSGWYKTDSRNSGPSDTSHKTETKSESKSDSGSEAKSESKPASTTTTSTTTTAAD